MDQGSYAEAARHAEAQLSGEESQAFWLTQQAKALVRSEDYREALRIARRAMELEPGNLYTVAVAADALLGQRSWEEALPLYEELLGNPRLARTGRRGVVECLAAMQQWDRILARLAEWRLPEEQAFAWKVRALKGQGRVEEALGVCEKWLQRTSDHPPALWERTELEIRRDGLETVLSKMKRMAKISSLPQVYSEIYASLCRRAGRSEEAIRAYSRITASGGQARIQKKKAFELAKSGREREALPQLEELLRAEPGTSTSTPATGPPARG